MPYEVATVKQIDDSRVHVAFTGPDVKDFGVDISLSADVLRAAREILEELNEVKGKPAFVEGQELDLTEPEPSPEDLAEIEYQQKRAQVRADNADLAAGILTETSEISDLRAEVKAATDARRAAK